MCRGRLVKTVMFGMVDGERPVGRPARRWSDDITLVQLHTARSRSTRKGQTSMENSHRPQWPTRVMSSRKRERERESVCVCVSWARQVGILEYVVVVLVVAAESDLRS